ncbi:MAG: hypothetical protein NTU85_03515 [Candidatus Kaiserbacteria bacterium]|nr:hypothetical protein [Candidatus Kaiserbacteria bacterium]
MIAGLTPVRGFYASSGLPPQQVPPTRVPGDPIGGNQVLGADCLSYLGSGGDVGVVNGVWENYAAYDWSGPDTCFGQIADKTVTLTSGQVVSQPLMMAFPPIYMDYGARWYATGGHGAPGTAGNPFGRLHFPPWMTAAGTYSITYQTPAGTWYEAPTYDGAFKTAMLQLIADAGARYSDNPQLVAVRVNAGLSYEVQPCCNGSCGSGAEDFTTVATAEEATITCDEYVTYIKDLMEAAYAAFPHQVILMQSCVSPCAGRSSKSLVSELMTDWHSRGMTRMGIGHNCVTADRADADERDGNVYADWRAFSAGPKLTSWGMPVAFEDAMYYPAGVDKASTFYWMAAAAAGAGGDIFSFMTSEFITAANINAYAWELDDWWWNADSRAWAILRDKEWPTFDYASGYGDSGYRGDFTKYLTLLNPADAAQVCEPGVRATAAAANAAAAGHLNYEGACLAVLPTPVGTQTAMDVTFNRQARGLAAGSTLLVAADTAWPYYGQTRTITGTVSYLDVGTDAFVVRYPNAVNASVSYTVTKTNTGHWVRAQFTGTAHLANVFNDPGYGDYFLSLTGVGGTSYLHEVFVDAAGAGTPLATPLPTATPGPYVSPTITPHPTATTAASRTPTPTGTPYTTPTPAYWWDSMEGTPPGNWAYWQPPVTGTPTPYYYWPTVVVDAVDHVDGAQSYRVSGLNCVGTGCAPKGGLTHPLSTPQPVGLFETSWYVHTWNDWFGQTQFAPIEGWGLKNASLERLWWVDANEVSNGLATLYLENVCSGVPSAALGAVGLDTWYTTQVAWSLGLGINDQTNITATFGIAGQPISTTATISCTNSQAATIYGITEVRAGVFDNYNYTMSTRPDVSIDDAWLVEDSLTTPTPAPTVVPATWPELACPNLAVALDGSLGEWAAVTPQTVISTTAVYTWPLTPTVTSLGGDFRCAHNGANIFFAGTITDTAVISPTGSVENGDAARVAVDGWADGLMRFLLDDHDLLVGSDGRVVDFGVYPILAMAVTTVTASGWQFEMSAPLASFEAGTAAGTVVGLTFGINDSVGGSTWAHVVTGGKVAGRLE